MKKAALIGLLFLSLGAGTAFSQAAPTANPTPATRINGSLSVRLTASGATTIYWDTTGAADFGPGSSVAKEYTGPIVLDRNTKIQTFAEYVSLGLITTHSPTVEYEYLLNHAPTASFTIDPGSTYITPARIRMTAAATDTDAGDDITKIEFRSGSTVVATALNPPPWKGDFETETPGTYTLTVIAYDSYGGKTTSTSRQVTITAPPPPNEAPTVALTGTPIDGGEYAAPYAATLTATASDDDAVAKVEFFLSGTAAPIGQDLTSPYSLAHTFQAGTYTVTAKATDNGSPALTKVSAPITFTVVAPENLPPVANAGTDFSTTLSDPPATLNGSNSSDPEDGTLAFQWTAPVGATLTGATTAKPTVTFADTGAFTFKLTVTDAGIPAKSSSDQVVVRVYRKPSITNPLTAGGTVGAAFSHSLTATGTQPIAFAATGLAGTGLTLEGNAITGTPLEAGPISVGLTATNAHGSDAKTLTITISGSNQAPTAAITFPVNGRTYNAPFTDSLRATATDEDGTVDQVEFTIQGSTPLTDNAAPFAVQKTLAAGTYKVSAKATDNDGLSGPASATVTFTVADVPDNQAPVAKAGADTTVFLSANLATANLRGTASSDTEIPVTLTYLWSGPAGATIAAPTAATTTVQFSGAGTYAIALKVTDAGTPKLSHSDTLMVHVQSKPAITSATTASGTVNIPFTYSVKASGVPVPELGISDPPTWLTGWNKATGVLSGTPMIKGTYTVTLTASSSAGTDSKLLTITVGDASTKPVINSDLTVSTKAGAAFTYAITADGTAPIAFTVGALPPWLAFTSPNLSGRPSLTQTGTFSVALTASNTAGNDNKTLTITVTSDPKITKDLDSLYTVNERSSVTLAINATGYPAVRYQWQYGTTVANIANSSISTTNSATINPARAGFYRVIVKNGAGPDQSSRIARIAVVSLPAPIRIVAGSGPTAQSVIQGERASFKTKATGAGPLLYQWYKGNASVTTPKANDTAFTITAASTGDAGVYRAKVTNSFTVETDPTTYAWSDTARLVVQLPKLDVPTATPPGGEFTRREVDVTLSNSVAGTNIYYTLDNSDPSETAGPRNFLYEAGTPLRLTATAILKARAYKSGYRASNVLTERYSYTEPGKVAKPTIRPPVPTFKTTLICTLATTTEGAAILYTTDLSDPAKFGKTFEKSIAIDTTTTIIAIARKTGLVDSDTLMMTYTLESPTPGVLPPKADPAGKVFTGQLSVSLSTSTDSAVIRYTTDSTEPDSLDAKYDAPIKIAASTTLKFFAMRKGFNPSPVITEIYKLIPGPITATPPPAVFENDILVKLSAVPAHAVIHYSLDGAVTEDSDPFPAEGLLISTTTTINALAVADGASSVVTPFGYTKRGGSLITPSPRTVSNSTTFKDTVRVFLSSSPGADIYYTLNGDPPDELSRKYTPAGILLDTTTTIQAIAKHSAFQDSRNMVATYTLVPDKPTASPPGGYSTNAVNVKLISSSPRAELYYTLNGADPSPHNWERYVRGDSIHIAATTVLKYVAVAGNMSSAVAEDHYNIFEDKYITLLPGSNAFLEGGYTLRNPEGQNAVVSIRLSSADSLRLNGFDGIQYSITVSLGAESADAGVEFPNLMFTSPVSEVRSVYKLDPSGKVYFLSSTDTVTLSQAGIYFLGLDVAPPIIRYMSESIDERDSTEVHFQIEDNVANLAYDLKRNDNALHNVSQRGFLSPKDLSIKLKNPAGVVKPLYIQIFVTDYQTASFYPPDSRSMLPLSQRFAPFNGPSSWKIGSFAKSPYDFVGIPLKLTQALTLASLRKANSGTNIEGAAWSDATKKYVPLNEKESLNPGQGYWLASRTPLTSLSLPTAATVPGGIDKFTVRIKHGWNQIANPHLEDLYWPYSRILGAEYDASPIKGLWEYDPGLAEPDFVETEVLKPWRGYFVYNNNEDAIVELSTKPITALSLKKSTAGDAARYTLSLGWGSTRGLRLGADWVSRDGLGVEDEFALPRRGNAPYMGAIREGHALVSDLVRMNRDGILQWKVALDGSGDSLPPLHILSKEFPEGYEAWAASPSRSMKFRIEEGTRISASGLARDTLDIYAGPAYKMASFDPLRKLSDRPPDLDLRVSARNGGFTMHMSLPQRAKIRATVWGLDGKKKAHLTLGPLSEGVYRFEYESDFHGQGPKLTPGMYFLSVEIRGTGLSRRLTKKLVFAN